MQNEGEREYYDHWVATLEKLVDRHELLTAPVLTDAGGPRDLPMTTITTTTGRNYQMNDANPALGPSPRRSACVAATAVAPAWLAAMTLLALIAYYFVGIDQGAVSVFGSDTHVHEFVHDARHLLGFPCH